MHLTYHINQPVEAGIVADLFRDSGIRRPVDDISRIEKMLENANLIITAWDGDKLIGICRCLTDFAYCCYLSDLAVAATYQRRGIGKELIARTREYLGEEVMVLLLAAPAAKDYYGPAGFTKVDNGWIINRER
jgi:ribosomal protein S18 acetylase RimI-like enzyme